MVPLSLRSPFKSSSCVGFVVPIPTEPIPVVVITVPSVPTLSLSPTDKRPIEESNFNFDDVENSFEVLNNIS